MTTAWTAFSSAVAPGSRPNNAVIDDLVGRRVEVAPLDRGPPARLTRHTAVHIGRVPSGSGRACGCAGAPRWRCSTTPRATPGRGERLSDTVLRPDASRRRGGKYRIGGKHRIRVCRGIVARLGVGHPHRWRHRRRIGQRAWRRHDHDAGQRKGRGPPHGQMHGSLGWKPRALRRTALSRPMLYTSTPTPARAVDAGSCTRAPTTALGPALRTTSV